MSINKKILDLTEELYLAKRFVSVLSFANTVFALYAVLQSYLAHSFFLVLVSLMVFFFDCAFFAYSSRSWARKKAGVAA